MKNSRVSLFFRSLILTPEPTWQIELVTFCNILFHWFHYSGHFCTSLNISGRRKRRRKALVFVSGQNHPFPLANSKVKAACSCHRSPCRYPRPILVDSSEVLTPSGSMLIFIDDWTSHRIQSSPHWLMSPDLAHMALHICISLVCFHHKVRFSTSCKKWRKVIHKPCHILVGRAPFSATLSCGSITSTK